MPNTESLSRRQFLRGALGTAATAAAVVLDACGPNNSNPSETPTRRGTGTPTTVFIGPKLETSTPPRGEAIPGLEATTFANPFRNQAANEVLHSIGFTSGDFFKFPAHGLEKLTAMEDPRLFPIYAPTVLDQKDLIYKLSADHDVPPNYIATIMTIESTGINYAVSSAAAQGLFQVIPDNFPPEIRTSQEKMQDPETNGKYAMEVFTDCLKRARASMVPQGFRPTDSRVVARAFMAYNMGPDAIDADFTDLPPETQEYGDHMFRFAMAAEIARGLRTKGMNDRLITEAQSFSDIDARAYGAGQFHEGRATFEYPELNGIMYTLGNEAVIPQAGPDAVLPPEAQSLAGQVIEFKRKNPPEFTLPVSPAMRIWMELGGKGQVLYSDKNKDPKSWLQMTS